MAIVHAVIALALIEFIVFSMLVGRARAKYKIEAPAITGHPVFERYYRVHYNTLEQLVCFIPAMHDVRHLRERAGGGGARRSYSFSAGSSISGAISRIRRSAGRAS